MKPESTIVELCWWEIHEAGRAGMARAFDALRRERQHRYGRMHCPLGGVDDHIAGAIGEIAVAKYLNLFWSGTVGETRMTDVGRLVEVRAVRDMQRRLILHPDDKPLPFVLAAVVALPLVHLRGWINCDDGRRQEYWQEFTGRPAYFVPLDVLHSVTDLREVLKQ